MLEPYVEKMEKYTAYAKKICGCDDLKHDLVQDMYLKIHDMLTDEPSMVLSDGYIYRIMHSNFIDNNVRKRKEYSAEDAFFINLREENNENLDKRKELSEVTDEMPFKDKEILFKCQETSRRKVAKSLGVSVQTVINYENKAMEDLRKIWKNRD